MGYDGEPRMPARFHEDEFYEQYLLDKERRRLAVVKRLAEFFADKADEEDAIDARE